MFMRPCVCLITFCVLSTLAHAAPSFTASYVDGSAAQRTGASWQELSIGDSVSLDAIIRLEDGATVQLKGMGTDISLTQQGAYAMRDLLAARQKIGSPGVGRVLSSTLARLLKGPANNQRTAAGARGDNVSGSDDSGWVETAAQDDIQHARDSIQAGRYDEAIDTLTRTLGEATAEEIPEIRFYLAYSYSARGDTPTAIRQLAGAKAVSGASWANDYVLLQGKLLLDTFAFSQAVQWLTQPGNDLSDDVQCAPLYYFLLGLGFRGAGDEQNATRSLQRVAILAGESDMGQEASRLLRNQ
jgi:tetratricopeptide (TPR) repeat protein